MPNGIYKNSTSLCKKELHHFSLIGYKLRDNPRLTGKALQGKLSGLWRYRVGDFRLLCRIEDNELIILVIEIGHRKEIYK